MPKFAVYYIPEADPLTSDAPGFFQVGSAILGYDVRAGSTAPMPPDLRSKVGEINPAWQRIAQVFGFHLTISDAIDFNLGDLDRVEEELLAILNCFAPGEVFRLEQSPDFIPDWGPSIVLRYDPNQHLCALHALVVARINPIGTGSRLLRDYLENPDQFIHEPHMAARVLKFYSPRILGGYYPHFTLLNPYTGPDRTAMVQALKRVFEAYREITLHTICLLVQYSEEKKLVLYKEFKRSASGTWSATSQVA